MRKRRILLPMGTQRKRAGLLKALFTPILQPFQTSVRRQSEKKEPLKAQGKRNQLFKYDHTAVQF